MYPQAHNLSICSPSQGDVRPRWQKWITRGGPLTDFNHGLWSQPLLPGLLRRMVAFDTVPHDFLAYPAMVGLKMRLSTKHFFWPGIALWGVTNRDSFFGCFCLQARISQVPGGWGSEGSWGFELLLASCCPY